MNTLIAASENIEGNIGTCAIKKTSGLIDWIHTQVYFVNSCTGEIINSSVYIDWPMVIIFGFLGAIMVSALTAAFVGLALSTWK